MAPIMTSLLSGSRSPILHDARNEVSNAHRIYIDTQCNDGYPGSRGKFQATRLKSIYFRRLCCASLISNNAS